MEQALEMVKIAYQALDDKLAEDIRIVDIREISTIADYFIIADGTNKNQVQALVQNFAYTLKNARYHIERI